ncbi:MAG: IS66 family transposase [Acidimicrobiales bacterium]
MDLGQRVAELEEVAASFQVTVARLQEEIRKKDDALAAASERIKELEAALEAAQRAGKRQSSPFSKGEPKQDPKTAGRKPGEAHGRHGHRMVPAGKPALDLDAPLPTCCPHCGGEVEHERDAEQWQVDIGEMRPVTTRFRVGVGRCKKCGQRVQGRHPGQVSDALGAAGSQVGPGAKSWAAFLHYSLGLSWVKVQKLMARFGIVVTAGALCQASERSACTDLVPVHQELVERANSSPVLVMDETGWRIGGSPAWLWEATNVDLTVYWVAKGRGFEQACEVVHESYDGTIVRDGWCVYPKYEKAKHQTCIGHLLRRAKGLEERLPKQATPPVTQGKAILKEALAARDLSPKKRPAKAKELAERLDKLCQGPTSHDEVRKFLAHLQREAPAMFTFLEDERVDATNWRGEQAIRPAVVNRKVWGGNRTDRGALTQSTMTSIFRTAVQHGVDAIDYLTARARSPDPGLTILLG